MCARNHSAGQRQCACPASATFTRSCGRGSRAVTGQPMRCSRGQSRTCAGAVRYFALMAGAGPDGALVYRLFAQHKSQLGRLAYYLRAARLFATRRFPAFEVEFTPAASASPVTRKAVSVMATRIGNLGGAFSRPHGCARVDSRSRRCAFIILRPPALAFVAAMVFVRLAGLRRLSPFHQCVRVSAFSCRPLERARAPYSGRRRVARPAAHAGVTPPECSAHSRAAPLASQFSLRLIRGPFSRPVALNAGQPHRCIVVCG